jgi:hypothetical protein
MSHLLSPRAARGPLALAAGLALLAAVPARGSEVRDTARMFGSDAVRQAQRILDRVERDLRTPVIIETIESLGGRTIEEDSLRRARASKIRGVYVLISKEDRKLYVRDAGNFLGGDRREAIFRAFSNAFREGDFDRGLVAGAEAIAEQVRATGPPSRAPGHGAPAGAPPARPGRPGGGSSGLGILLVIGAVIVGVILLGRLFGNRQRAFGPGAPGPMAGPGAGVGPGMGGVGRGGGLWSSIFGGLGGALAGNWIYDQMTGRHHHGYGAPPADYTGGPVESPGPAPDDWGGTGGDWGGGGGGGDWAAGGGGGDWGGGGGGDWGGGGGDY